MVLKKLLLRIFKEPKFYGPTVGTTLGLLLGISGATIKPAEEPFWVIVGFAVVLGTVFGIVVLIPLIWIAKRLTTHYHRGSGIFVRVTNGKVVDSGNPIWGRSRSGLHRIELPPREPNHRYRVQARLDPRWCIEGYRGDLQVELTAIFRGAFDPQELYNCKVQYSNLEGWLGATFSGALNRQSKAIQRLLTSRKTVAIPQAIADVVQGPVFDQKSFRNLRRISVQVVEPPKPPRHKARATKFYEES